MLASLSNILTSSASQIAALNGVLAVGAASMNVWGALYTSGWLRRMFQGIASLAFFYAASYFWLAWNPDRAEEWSLVLRPFGILTWIVAWSLEPFVVVKYLGNKGKYIRALGDQKVEEARQAGVDVKRGRP